MIVLFHRVADPDCATVRRRVVELGLKPRVDFHNVDTDGAASFSEAGGRGVPALWDGRRLVEGRDAVLDALAELALVP